MEQFKFDLQMFAGETFIPDEGTQLLTISGNVLKPASGSILSGNTLSFEGSSSSSASVQRHLNDYSWAEISAIAQAGTGADYFNIGDCKEIKLNGNIGNRLTLNNEALYVFILHFNYPMNNVADNNIIFGGFKTSLFDGTDIALCDTSSSSDKIRLSINHWDSYNYGGWKGADCRYDILGITSTPPSDYGAKHTDSCIGYNATAAVLTNPKENTLLAALPSDFRSVLRLWSRWIDAKGNKSNTEEGIEETVDIISFLAEFEVHGFHTYANEYEQNHQTQMEYYRLGNSTVKYKHSDTLSAVRWCYASPVNQNNFVFCGANTDGTPSGSAADYSCGMAPAFKV